MERASAGRLEVVPLGRADVTAWRQQALGPDPVWAPTLIRLDEDVRAWTGPRMALPLVRRLGPRASMRVLSALGELRRPDKPSKNSLTRGQFLRLGGGAAVAAGVLLTSSSPALGADRQRSQAREWVAANAGKLPQRYDEVVAHAPAYRRAIYEASSPAVRSQLWVEQLTRQRGAHLSAAQRDLLDKVLALATDEATFSDDPATRSAARPRIDALRDTAKQVFERDQVHAMFVSLGPALQPGVVAPEACDVCECSTEDDWCSKPARYCREITCSRECDQPHGCHCFSLCGFLYSYECNGYCEIVT
ncbi:bacteriocin fulvocin C-related protein [Fodinicola acaciae]|uniref:bacteriocin fulvocin C-related protein n=1 Tax=Fodinicola acaciae TaxID=2681555 RepID=UPI0013CF6BAF|nr:bacteriocin fulvocin C-related protein [Fodinicola acaciae]